MAQITVEEFRNFFKYYKGEEHQQRAVELFYEDLQHECCEHLDNESAWITQYRTRTKRLWESPLMASSLHSMEQLTGHPASSFDDVFVNDCNRLFADTGFDKHLDAMQMLMANMMHETVTSCI